MAQNFSIEAINGLFHMHGYAGELVVRPDASLIIQELVNSGELNQLATLEAWNQAIFDRFQYLKQKVIAEYGSTISDEDLFTVLDVIDFIETMIADDGMGIAPQNVFQFLTTTFATRSPGAQN